MENKIDLKKLTLPFKAEDIEWRLQQSGEKNGKIWAMCLAYVTNRAIMDRLDEVCGPENWKNDFAPAPEGGILCGISIKCGDEWVTKWDGAENTQVEAVKGGLSSAMKRAGSQWGIGRYLYNLESGWADVADNGKFSAKTKDNKWFKWNPPALPSWALPEGTKVQQKKKADPTKVMQPPEPSKPLTLNEYMEQALGNTTYPGLTAWYKENLGSIRANLGQDGVAAITEYCGELKQEMDAINAG